MIALGSQPLSDEISDHAHETVSWYLLGVLFKIPDKHPRLFYVESPPTGGIDIRRNNSFHSYLTRRGNDLHLGNDTTRT